MRIAVIPLGRLADTRSRRAIMAWGLIVWSGFTALAAASWSFSSFLFTRIGVGIGEASYGPAAIPLIGDLFPANKRSRAMGIFVLGLPLGLILASCHGRRRGAAFDSWRAPFVVAMVPGLLIAVLVLMIREPARGAAETWPRRGRRSANPIRKVLDHPHDAVAARRRHAANFAAYAANSFMVPLIQRYFGMALEAAAVSTGVIVGVTGLVGLTLGGWLADWLHERSERGRLTMGGVSLALAAAATWSALILRRRPGSPFSSRSSPRLAAAICLLCHRSAGDPGRRRAAPARHGYGNLFRRRRPARRRLRPGGGRLSVGPRCCGGDGGIGRERLTEQFKAVGLHDAMLLVPITLFATASLRAPCGADVSGRRQGGAIGMAGKELRPAAA